MSKLFFSGSENGTLFRALYDNGVRRVLFSFYWITAMRREKWVASLKEKYPDVELMLDSGAFTYSQKVDGDDLPPPKLFFKRYQQYLREYGHLWDHVMELDVDGDTPANIDSDQVDHWTGQLLDEFPDLRIYPVYHSWRGQEAWDEYLADERVRGLAIGRSPPLDGAISAYIDKAHQKGVPVHGLAFTKYNTSLPMLPFDTIDSSSWASGQKYGNFYLYQNGKILNITTKNRAKMRVKLLREYIKARGCDPEKIYAGDRGELLQCNIRTWILVSKRLEEMRKEQIRVLSPEHPKLTISPEPQPRNSSFDLRSFILSQK